MEPRRGFNWGRIASAGVALSVCAGLHGEITNYTDEALWTSAAGAVTKVGVPDVPLGYPITAFLPYGLDLSGTGLVGLAAQGELYQWIADVWGIPTGTGVFAAGANEMVVRLTSPVHAYAQEWVFVYPRLVFLFMDDELVGSVGQWLPLSGADGLPRFYGVTSSVPFNRVKSFGIFDNQQYGKHIMYSQIVPAPGAIALLALAPVACARRRR